MGSSVYREATQVTQVATTTYSPVSGVSALFPRPHPSAQAAGWLGVAALLGLGLLAGVPAILLGRLVLAEIAEADGRYSGVSSANLGINLGWAGTLVSSLLAVYGIATNSESFGYTMFGAGVVGAVALAVAQFVPNVACRFTGITGRARVIACIGFGGLMLAGLTGASAKHHADEQPRQDALAKCGEQRQDADAAISRGDFRRARSDLGAARQVCVGDNLSGVDGVLGSLADKETAYKKKLADEEADRKAKAAEEREQKAKWDFPTAADATVARIKLATTKAAQGQWEAAASDLDDADAKLNPFKETRIEKGQRWIDLTGHIAATRKRIAPGLEQIRKAKETRERQIAAVEEARQKQEDVQRKAQEVAAAAAEHEASRGLVCGDGSSSPSCLCHGSHRGCCSHHGGVVGCGP